MIKRNPGRNEAKNSPVIWKAGSLQWDLSQRAIVMAILNVTPDSISDGGRHFDLNDTVFRVLISYASENAPELVTQPDA